MKRCSAPGLGSLVIAKESVEAFRFNAGRRSSDAGRVSAVWVARRSKALFGRRLSCSGDVILMVAWIRGRVGEAPDVELCLECLSPGMFDIYWPALPVPRLSAVDDSGCKDFGRDIDPNGKICGLWLALEEPIEGGVTFSLVLDPSPWFCMATLGAPCEVCKVGTDRSEYILGLGAAFDDFKDEETLSGGDLERRDDLALLLLDRRPVLMNGKRSFIRADSGVSIRRCVMERLEVGLEAGRYAESRLLEPGLDNRCG